MLSRVVGEVGSRADQAIDIAHGAIARINHAGPRYVPADPNEYDAGTGALVPLLWDHHVHLRALSARDRSLDLSSIRTREALATALRHAPQDENGWVRAVAYDDSVLGELDRHSLDDLGGPSHRIRVQHRSGHQWVVNSAGLAALPASTPQPTDGIYWGDLPSLGAVSTAALRDTARSLHKFGVYGVTDMTPVAEAHGVTSLREAVSDLLDIRVFGAASAAASCDGVKLIAADHSAVDPDLLATNITTARPLPVAIHSVTPESLTVVTWALHQSHRHGDRVEHAFIAPAALRDQLAALDIAVGAHPGFIRTHGDRVLNNCPVDDVIAYQPLRSWLAAGTTLYGGTDTPFSLQSPWQAMQAAVDRTTRSGQTVNESESLSPETAFALFSPAGVSTLDAPAPTLREGSPASFLILDRSWAEAREELGAVRVRAVVLRGELTELTA